MGFIFEFFVWWIAWTILVFNIAYDLLEWRANIEFEIYKKEQEAKQ